MINRVVMISRCSIAIATLALLTTVGCKKEDTTPPDGEQAVADEADPEEVEEPEAEEAVEEEEGPVQLTKAGFDETIHDHFSEISDCYLAALEANPELAGTLNAEFTFEADGSHTMVALEGSSLNDEGLVNCIAEASNSWDFGVPKEAGMKMNYPIKLEPAE